MEESETCDLNIPAHRLMNDLGKNNPELNIPESNNPEFESVTLTECLDLFTADEIIKDYSCPVCEKNVDAVRHVLVLVITALKFEMTNAGPQKIDVPVVVPHEQLSLDKYLGQGLQHDEETLPESESFKPNQEALDTLKAMGFGQVACEKALLSTGNSDVEQAANWLFAHIEDSDLNEPHAVSKVDPQKRENLTSMGFTLAQSNRALKETSGDVQQAVEWLFNHGHTVLEDEKEPSINPNSFGCAKLPANYRLDSIVCHKGRNVHTGHYVSFIRKYFPETNSFQWIQFNDEKVVVADNAEEMSKFAYIYFFRRQ
ncbi:Ubiquitin carboxyl-terminal hydrolase 14 [Neolecta irregularis DAH-3]|uniref:Ubiquitin carboxyl-terminal hydrolase 14 n=1 Tax=Neolecta irregularis (strain DAH-3) TaxID=1198029 RepID=A0A1U7LKD2_NEOID|nr:Ubiquitin carboxyl-terminal hydrolase 14 [Neolecta irregularis DAH-3]|eukprot:OLL22981.1 Ubiquitin carboxyl-terminal hydrolase 14 [Neolecta irregularis DAH-3]